MRRGRSRGQALVEFALVAPFLFILLLSVIEFARFIYYSETLNSAVREGARFAIVHGSESLGGGTGPGSGDPNGTQIANIVRRYAIAVVQDADFLIKVCWPGQSSDPDTWDPDNAVVCRVDNKPESFVKVTLDYQYKLLIPLVPLPNVELHAESILVINH